MSSKVPPDYPEPASTEQLAESTQTLGEIIGAIVATAGGTAKRKTAVERAIDAQVRAAVAQLYEKERASKKRFFPEWLVTTLQGITLATIVGCAFWLGSLSSTVSRSAEKLDKLSDAVMNPSRDGMANRLSVIETKLDTINEKLENAAPAPKNP